MPEEQIGIDDVDETNVEPQVAKDRDGIPYCTDHHCRMRQKSGGRKGSPKKYYGCPVPGCDQTGQVIKTRHENVVPQNPVECPRCARSHGVQYCKRDPRLSKGGRVVLRCPACNWCSSAMPLPQLASAEMSHRLRRTAKPPAEDIGDR